MQCIHAKKGHSARARARICAGKDICAITPRACCSNITDITLLLLSSDYYSLPEDGICIFEIDYTSKVPLPPQSLCNPFSRSNSMAYVPTDAFLEICNFDGDVMKRAKG